MANNLVTATCPNCNSPLQIKEGQDFVKCEYCGTISSAPKAIEYHQHQSTSYNFSGANPVVNFSNGQDLETLVKNADMHLKLKNYADAQSIYEKISKEYPHDYRGWWGLILVESRELTNADFYIEKERVRSDEFYKKTCLTDTFRRISFDWKNVKETAPAKITAELAAKFQPYYDMGYTAYEKALYTNSIPEYQIIIAGKEDEKSKAEEKLKRDKSELESSRHNIKSCKSSIVLRKILGVVLGIVAILFAVYAFGLFYPIETSDVILSAVIAIVCAVYSFKQPSAVEEYKDGIKFNEKSITQYSTLIPEDQKKIDELNKEIEELKNNIKEFKDNLAKAEKKLAELTRKA